MENDKRVACFALQLQNQKIVTDDAHRGEIDWHFLSALWTPHLLLDSLDDLGKRVRVDLHEKSGKGRALL